MIEHVDRVLVQVDDAAIFSNWIPLRGRLDELGLSRDVDIDLSRTRLVDHTVMSKLEELSRDYSAHDRRLTILGLDQHRSVAPHPQAARRRVPA